MERYVATQFYKADSPESRILRESGIAPSEFVLAADAQATLAALQADNRTYINERHENMKQIEQLQARVRELEQWVQDQSTANLETMRHTDEMQSRALEAEQQLTQRTAECDALKLVNDTHMKTVMKLSHVVEQRTAEFQRHDGELQQICGQALGYPWFKDDQKNFPGATEKGGVCVGEHVGITIAQELANAYRKRTAELEAAKGKLDIILRVSRGEPDDELAVDYGGLGWENDPAVLGVYNLIAELERVTGLVKTYADAKTDFDDKRLQEDHHAWRERYTRLVGAETILIALTATSQPAKSAGKMHACDVPGCVSCGNPEDTTSQEGQHGSR